MSRSANPVAFAPRGLYVGVSEIALLAGVTRQMVRGIPRSLQERILREPAGFIDVKRSRYPYWFQRDIVDDLRAAGRLHGTPTEPVDIQPWEYEYEGELVTVSGFSEIGGFSTGNVHPLAAAKGITRYADKLRMGVLWRREELGETLARLNYPKARP